MLLTLLDSQNPAILGNENANLPKLLNIFIEAILSGVLSQELSARMTNTMKAILSSLPESTRQQFWNSLPVEKRQGLQEAGIV
jgi:importin-5